MQSPIGSGRTAEIYRYDDGMVLKLFRPGFKHMATMEYERAVQVQALHVSCPHAHRLVEKDGRRGIVYDFAPGASLTKALLQKPWHLFLHARKMARMHAALHEKHTDKLPQIKQSLSATISNLKTLDDSAKGEIIAYLASLAEGDALCHMDFHPDNILVDGSNAQIIDWMTACRGDPCADVCRSAMILGSSSVSPGTPAFAAALISLFRKTLLKSYLKEYTRITGRSMDNIDKWLLPIAAARMNEDIPGEREYLQTIVEQQLALLHEKGALP